MEPIVLCGANSYEEKYYFNPLFDKIPQQVKDELQILCVVFTEEVGGIMVMQFDEEGTLQFQCHWDEEDLLYDEIGAELMIKRYRREKEELLVSLEQFYRVFV
ncbi:MAG: hypothetical protein E7269_05575 [Lachnospiraceae bacterium]|nr:hypothetical protein [Lachnospiraceae bacterium]